MKYFITGGCGFLGSNIASELLMKGERVVIFDNLQWLKNQAEFNFYRGDIRNREDVENSLRKEKPDVVFHLAGQVAMATSLERPRFDFEVNVIGSFNVLECIRREFPEVIVVYSSTNKVYGDLEWVQYQETESRYVPIAYPSGFSEDIPLDFHSPYGVSKGSADQYMLDYHRMFGVRTVVFRHSSMYGERQFATHDQGWIGWFCQKAFEQHNNIDKTQFAISGNGKQVRDVLHASDMVSLYLESVRNIEKIQGHAFNIGGGMANSLSLLELIQILENEFGTKLNYNNLPPRESDQKVFVADIAKAKKLIGWLPQVDKRTGLRKMITWIKQLSST
jgi:CDP-paratose 2-epimerase